jgi:hypothetical protein
MTRETAKQQIDMMPDNAFEVYSEMFTAFIAYVIKGEKQPSAVNEETGWQRKKIPEKITSISQLFGTLPPMTHEEIRDMRLAEKEKRLR